MRKPQLFGADYSVYVRISRLCLYEKGVEYDLIPVDIFLSQDAHAPYLKRHPFGKIPSFEHEDFRLYETGAITRYIDEAFQGPALQPADPKKRARVTQIISIADSYIYPQLVWGMYVELISKPARGETPDETRVIVARAKTPLYLEILSNFLEDNTWFGGDHITLADIYVAPMIDYFLMVPEGQEMLSLKENLLKWWLSVGSRPSMQLTRPTE